MIDLHYVATGNNLKVAIMLEEAALPYNLVKYEMYAGTHLTPQFRRINPNNKLPAIVDHQPADGGEAVSVFESGAILLYLAEKSGMLLPQDARRRLQAQQWLIWQVAGLGPMLGQAHHFVRYAPEGQAYGIERYTRESRRLLEVLEYRLKQSGDYLAGDYSIADIACYPWASGTGLIGIDIAAFPAVAAWLARIKARPAVQRAADAILDESRSLYTQPRPVLTPEQWSNMFGDKLLAAAKAR
ncbi:glutathione S-transferase N-terminal domain-containing protein [Reyranella sp. CPCC 100927]|uniref:glutathione S-transferase N-terminal domain-containing protein n=1 Tax=Reyranella sp. CPCC 100927 TaxID=2599616 RepID=UPI0011B535CE|nr:glutathione S-transferase N-terminal domain-containing protein [Reyranella sp. CPCC 100927]TWT04075.1 thiol:disulfide oxidoreductase [Reyranella sp. CPCC 100927]